ncbi:MAG: YIP1 family protein [Candidatus Acidiferrum sp.]
MATTIAVPPVSPEPQPAMSALGRVAGVFFSPKKTYEDVVRKPGWLVPVVLLTVLSILVSVSINQRINWRDFMAQQIEKSARASQLSPEQKEQQISAGAKITPIFTYSVGVVGPILGVLIIGLIMWGAYSLLGGISTNFGTAIGISAHAFLTGLISSPIFILVLFLKEPGTVDLQNPIATNVAAFLPDDSAAWLVALCKSFDIFTFWTLILLAIGFAAVNPKKLKGSKPYTIAFSVWAAYVVCRVGWAFIFS